MSPNPQLTLVVIALIVGIILMAGVVYTAFNFKKMGKHPEEFKGSDPETHYRR